MNRKKLLIMACLLFIIFTTISTASSEEIDDELNETVNHTHTSISEVISRDVGDPPGTFTELNTIIQGASDGQTIYLYKDYAYVDSDSEYILGINIHKNIIIDGQGHTINGSDKARIFAVGTLNNAHSLVDDVTLRNINFANARNININSTSHGNAAKNYAFGAVEFYGNGRIINCNFTNNYAFCAAAMAIGYGNYINITGCNFINNTGFGQGGGAIRLRTQVIGLTISNSLFANNYGDTYGGAVHSDMGYENNACTVINTTFINNTAKSGGGGLFFETPNANLINSTFIGNNAPLGGGVYWNGYSGDVSGSYFIGNNATTGGGVFCSGRSTTHITTSNFINNSATNGGGIYFDQSEGAAIYDCSFNGNEVIDDGGAIYCAGKFFVLNNSNFTKDIAHRDGGSTYFDVGAYVNNCAFDEEHADRNGGGMYVYSKVKGEPPAGVELGVFNSNFTNCSAGNNGGAGYVFTDYGVVKNSILINCTANNFGGGGYISGSYGKLIDSHLIENTASNGGGVYWEGNNGTLLNTEISGNIAINGNGGGVYWVGANGNLTDSNFSKNYAIDGIGSNINFGNGGGLMWIGSNGTMTNSSFDKSSSTHAGGAVYISGDNIHITTSDFQRSNSTKGGGLYVEGDDVNITYSSFSYGEADYGGILYIDGKDIVVADSNLSYCYARVDGGAFYVEGNNAKIIDSNLQYSYADHSGGAMYINGEHTTFSNSNLKYNNATFNGGSVYINGSDANITDSSFQFCTANNGGAIYIEGFDAKVINSNFTQNKAIFEFPTPNNNGGSIYIAGNNALLLESNFAYNSAGNGGSIYVTGNNTNITKTNFQYVSVTDYGGAIYIGGVNTTISESNFTNINASEGGALYVDGNNTAIIDSFFRFGAAKDGGAIYIEGSDTHVLNSSFLQNGINPEFDLGDTKGGSIYIAGDNTIVSASNFTQNSAGDGGSMYITGDNTNITKSRFQYATAAGNGGSIYIGGINTTITDSALSYSNATNGGAIYVDGKNSDIEANFSYCFAKKGNGGAIYVSGDNNNITNSNFTITMAIGGNGGAIYAGGNNITIIHSSSDIANAIRNGPGDMGNGGAVYIFGDGVKIIESSFFRYNSTDNGGGLYVQGHDVNITNSSFGYGESKFGGAVYINGNNTYVENSNLTRNHALNDGGIIYINGDNAIITDSNLQYSYAYHSGGAVFIKGANNLITKSNLTFNNATNGYGGSIYIEGAMNNITDSLFEYCSSTKGGAIYINGEKAHIIDSNFSQNGVNPEVGSVDDTAGGAIYIEGDNAIIFGDSFSKGNALNGGIIYVEGDNINISSSNFTQSVAKFDGGAIYIAGSNVTVFNSSFSLHNATNGSAIYISGHDVDVISSNFSRTFATGGSGGAIYVGGNNADVIESEFDTTIAINGNGGAIYVSGNNSSIVNSSFNIGNAIKAGPADVGYGGMVYISGEGVSVINSNFSKSNASLSGGAVYIAGDDAIINNSYFEYSESERGGTVFIRGTNATLLNSNLTYSYARRSGGSIYVNGEETKILNSKLDFAHAERYGGAIFINGTNTTIDNSYLLHNYVVNLGGGSVFINGNNTFINGSVFQYGTANTEGGSVYINGSNTFINGSVFQYGVANNGGALYVAGEETLISNSSFLQNNVSTSSGRGGTIYIAGDKTHINSSTFKRSNANQGGIIYILGNNTNITYSNFTMSYSYNDGGALYVNGVNATIDHSKFFLHNATVGGAVYIKGENTLITYSEFNESSSSGVAGGIYLGGTNTRIYNSTFNENSASQGGAVYNNGGTALIIDSNFTNNMVNSSSSNGGAIFWKGASINDIIANCLFENNSAYGTAHGGAIYWERGSVPTTNASILNSTFINNTSERHGGAIDWYNANNGTIENCVFIENYAVRDGGALYIGDDGSNGENLTINNSIFIKNHAGVKGGALSMQFYNSKVINCNFTDNYASGAGSVYMNNVKANHTQYINCNFIGSYTTADNGGVAIINVPYIDFINCTFENCTVPSRMLGAGIYFNTKANYSSVIDSNFTNCSNARIGGAIYISSQNINISGSIFKINNATEYGGAIYIGGYYTVIEKSQFINNTANKGGAVIILRSKENFINDSIFANNHAESDGGSIYIGSNEQVLNDLIIENSTAERGGGIYIDGASEVYISSSSINSNLAEEGAGIYLDLVDGDYIINTNITNNNATKGSGIYAADSEYILMDVILLDNQAHGNEFINEAIKMAENGTYYLTGTFLGYDNRLNGIWDENSEPILSSVTFWGADGIEIAYFDSELSDREMGQNVTVKRYNSAGTLIGTDVVVTNETGDFIYEFEDDGDTLVSFTMNHLTDNYYTEINKDITIKPTRVTIEIEDINLGENATVNVTLTDAEGNPLSGTVRIIINDSNKNFTITVTDGKGSQTGVSGLSAGTHNATVTYEGNTEYLGSTNSTTFNVRTALDLTINKTVDKTLVNVSDIVEFTITVTNKGPSNATGVNVTDILNEKLEYINSTPSQGTYNSTTGIWTIGNITSGLSVNIKIRAKVLTNGTIPNFANVTSIENDTNTSNNNDSSDNITANPKVNLTIIKTANITNATVGDTVNFTITVYNNGPSNATNLNITDVLNDAFEYLDSNLTPTRDSQLIVWNIGNLENGTNTSVWLTVKLLTNGTFSNIAITNATETLIGNTSNITNITVYPLVNLTINKESNATNVSVNDIVRFNLTVFNTGLSNATNVQIYDNLSSGFEFINANGTYDRTGQNIIWTIPLLENGTNATVWVDVRVLTNGTFSNFATVNSTEDPIGNKSNTTNITVNPKVNLTIIKTANITNATVGDIVNFTITVINNGPSNATNIEITDTLNDAFEWIKDSGATRTSNTLKWIISSLANGTNTSVWLTVKLLTNGTYPNIAKVNCSENTTEIQSNETNVTITPNVNLTIIKTANITNVTVGDIVNFTITVYNTGLSNATNVKIVDVLDNAFNIENKNGTPSQEDKTLTWTIDNLENGTNATFWVSIKVLTNGTFSNIASVNSTEHPKNTNSNVTNITAIPNVEFLIVKTVNVSNVNAGDIVNFTITISNTGLSNATRIQLTDVLNPAFRFIDSIGAIYKNSTLIWGSGAEYLRPGDSVTVWFTAQVMLNGTFSNLARGVSAENPTGNVSNEVTVTAKANVNLSITKNVDIASVSVGDIVNYTLTVYNNGFSNATNVEVFDELAEGLEFVNSNIAPTVSGNNLTWIIPNLANGTNTVIWLTVKVMVDGNFTNFATVNSTENITPNKSNEVNITVGPYVNLTIVKSANVTGNVSVGDIVNFTITAYNIGLSNATNVEIVDDLDPAFLYVDDSGGSSITGQRVIWKFDNLENGTNKTVWITVKVLNNGTFSNFATVNSSEIPRGNTSNITNITANPKVNLTITKIANATNVSVGDTVRFNIRVTNNGPSNATNIEIKDILGSEFQFVNAEGTYSRSGQTITWTIPFMPNGTNRNVWVDVKVLTNGTFSNIATTNCSENTTNISSNKTNITVKPAVNLTITKIGNTTVAKVNDLVNFTITVTNNGPSNATEVNVTDLLPNELVYVSSGSNITGVTGTSYVLANGTKIVLWTIPMLTNGSSAKLWVVVNITSNGTFTNLAFANSKENTTNKTNETNVTVKPVVDLVINKTVDKTVVNVSDTVEFTITVTNNGPSNATDVNVTDILDEHLEYVGSTPSQGTYDESTHIWTIGNITNGLSVNLKIRAKVISNGTIPNFAFVTSNETDTNTSNNNDSSDNITAKPLVILSINKTANTTTGRVGDLVNFTITVHNYGPSNGTNVQIKDVLNPAFAFVSANGTYNRNNQTVVWTIGNLVNGSEVTVNVIVKVLVNGTYSNVAIVNSTENPTGNESNETNVTSNPDVEFTIIKIANVTGNVSVGDLVNFTITVYNTGLSNATNVEVVDKLDSAFEYVSAMDNVPMDSDRNIIWNIGNLATGTSKTVWVTVKVLTNGTFSNIAMANSTENPTGNKSNKTNVTVTPTVNLTIIKFSNLTEGHNVSIGDLVKFTIVVINNGPSNATNLNIEDVLEDAFIFVSANASGTNNGQVVHWTIPHLENGTNVSVEVVVETVKNGFYSNFAVVNSTESENKTSNETPIIILPAVNLTVVKTSNVTDKVGIGDLVNFTIVVTNNGPSTATGVNVTDFLPSGLEYVESGSNITGVDGDSITLPNGTNIVLWNVGVLNNGNKALVWVTVRVLESGTLVNIAHANSNENTTGTSNETEVNVSNTVDLSITKSVNKRSITVGDSVVYTITVTNKGSSDASNVIVREILTGDVEITNVIASKGTYNKVTRLWIIPQLLNGEVETLKLTVKALKAETIGNKVSVTSDENDTNKSNNNYTSPNVIVNKLNTPINLETINITYGEIETLTVTLPRDTKGYVDIIVDNITYNNQTIVNGTVVLEIPNLAGGEYNVKVTYAGDDKYDGNSTKGTFTVAPLTPSINIEVADIFYGEIEVLNVTVNAPGTVNITVSNKTISYVPLNHSETTTDMSKSTKVYNVKTVAHIISLPIASYSLLSKYGEDTNTSYLTNNIASRVLLMSVLDYDGKATWNLINLPVGTYPVFAVYNGNENYSTVNASGEFTVIPLSSWVNGIADDIFVGEDAIINISVIPNATGNVTITIENNTYTTTIENGKAQFIVSNLKAGEKQVEISYNGDSIYAPSENTTTFTVNKIKPTITVDTYDIYVGDNETITITLPQDATGNVTVTIGNETYILTLENGEAKITLSGLEKGTYTIYVTYSGDDKYLPIEANSTFNVLERKNIEPHSDKHDVVPFGLGKYSTGYPILILLLALLATGFGVSFKRKK